MTYTLIVCILENMNRNMSTTHKRINFSLPRETISLIDRIVRKGDRSRLVDIAVLEYIEEVGRRNLRKRLKEGALKRAGRDLAAAAEWFKLDEEAWPKGKN